MTQSKLALLVCAALLAGGKYALSQEPAKTGPETEKRFPPLVVPEGFTATLFACDPLIEYPSAIAAGPRPGAVFVAVDYMTGLGTEIVRRSEVRLVEDVDGDGYADRAPVFAAGFNSIEGLTWHEGTLYVMHAPFLTAVKGPNVDGQAGERTDLISGLGLTPDDNPVRLHCANGVTVGHDGWLYLALGDHGCNVLRPEGDRLVFDGGGILRCRPDGRDLHVFSTGLRNIYDVALDDELNVFVRDNENDGGTYKIRVCHSFFGADHGYPYLYEERPDEALAPLADLGLGSSAGGVCYLETHFPAEYCGHLIFCEWGKSVVRYPLARKGSSFERPAELEFAVGARGDSYGFKPTDVVVQRDGTLMVADYADGQRPKRGRGRIYRIAYGAGPQKLDVEREKTTDEWLEQLDAESYFARCEAQSAIQRQGASGVAQVKEALARGRLKAIGRLHAIWILAASQRLTAIDELLEIAMTDAEPRVRAQAVRAIADLADPVLTQQRLDAGRGDSALAERLAGLAKEQEAQVRLEICIALARLRWTGTAEWLRENIADADQAFSHAAMQALRKSDNWPAVLRLLDLPHNNELRAIAIRALAERHESVVVDELIMRLDAASNAPDREVYADLLTRVYRKPGPWTYWGYRPPPRPANTVSWERTEAIERALDRVLATSEPATRHKVLERMRREQVPLSAATLVEWLAVEREAERVAAILAALHDQRTPAVREQLVAVVRNHEHTAANRQAALATLGETLDMDNADELLELSRALEDGPVLADALRRLAKFPKLAAGQLLVRKLASSTADVRAAAVQSIGELRVAVAPEEILGLLTDGDVRVRRSAAIAAGRLDIKAAVEPLLALATSGDAAVRSASFESLRLLKVERAVPLAAAALQDANVSRAALACVAELGGPDQAGAVLELAKHNPQAEVVALAIRALADWHKRQGITTTIQQGLDRTVAEIHGNSGILVRWDAAGPGRAELISPFVVRSTSTKKNIVTLVPGGWRKLFASGAEGHLVLAAKEATPDGQWFARSAVRVAEPTEVEFLASSSGRLQVWLNENSIFERKAPGKYTLDSDRFSATLAAGDNRLGIVIANSAAPVEFHLRFRRKSAKGEHEKLAQAALARAGNAERGRQILLNAEKSQCLKCHRLGEQGERVGPELTGIGSRFSRIHVVESILEPSRTIAPSFGSVSVLLNSGQTLMGVKTAESETEVTLVDQQGQKHIAIKSHIEAQKPSLLSTMPEGLEKRLSEQEFVDLVGYLMSQKETAAQ